jgi:single-strand DNA-binding protein
MQITVKTMQITGRILSIQAAQQVTEKFIKRTFVIETGDEHPQVIQLELQGKSVGIIEEFDIGREVVCGINIRGRAWTNPQGEVKYFNTITCSKIQLSGHQSDADERALGSQGIPF